MKSSVFTYLVPGNRFVPVVTGIALALSVAGAEANADRSSLIENSPFVWEGYTPPQDRRPQRETPPPAPEDDPLDRLELRGIIVMGGETRVSFFHPDNQEGFWLPLDGSEGGYTVVNLEGRDSVTVRRGDRERSITLKEAQVGEMPRQQARGQQGGRQQQQTQQAQAQPANAQQSDEDLRRAAEVLRQRRALRQQN